MEFLKKYGLLAVPAYTVLMDVLSIPNLIQYPEFLIPNLVGCLLMVLAIFLSIKVRRRNRQMRGFAFSISFVAILSVIVAQMGNIVRGHFYVSPINLIAFACIVINLIPALKNKQQKEAVVSKTDKQTSAPKAVEAKQEAVPVPSVEPVAPATPVTPVAPATVAEVSDTKVKGNILYGPLESSGFDDTTITVTDVGFHFVGKAMRTGNTVKKDFLDTFVEYTQCPKVANVMGTFTITANGYSLSFVPNKESKPAIDYIVQQVTQASYNRDHKDHIMRCNVCGQIFTYTYADYNKALNQMKSAAKASVVASATFMGSSMLRGDIQRGNAQAAANAAEAKWDEIGRCPNCRSTNATEITAEEAAAARNAATAPAAPASSSMDELKKLKELLDIGVITQEEFDAKKKQLLGL